MWCHQCHQEVAGVLRDGATQRVCAKCGGLLPAPRQATAPSSEGSPRPSASRFELPNESHDAIPPSNATRPAPQPQARNIQTEPTGPNIPEAADRFDPRTSLAALDRELTAVEEILKQWQEFEPPRSQTGDQAPADSTPLRLSVVPLPKSVTESGSRPSRTPSRTSSSAQPHSPTPTHSPARLAQRLEKRLEHLQATERQVGVLLFANTIFLMAGAILGLWSLASQTGGWLSHWIGVAVTGQVGTLFCVAWFLAQLRQSTEGIDDIASELSQAEAEPSSAKTTRVAVPEPASSDRSRRHHEGHAQARR